MAKLRFFRHTGTPEGVEQGDIVFNPQTKRIGVYIDKNTGFEQYGGDIENVTFVEGVLTITKKAVYDKSKKIWENPTITLDFSDVASATDVSKVVGGLKATVDTHGTAISTLETKTSTLRTDVDNLQKEVEGDEETTGLLDRVATLESSTGSEEGSLGWRVSALEDTVGDSDKGLVKTVNDHTTLISSLTSDKANVDDVYTKSEVDGKLASAYKAQGSKTAEELTNALLDGAKEGYVYNLSDELKITDANKGLFVEGVKSTYPVGTNVVVVKVDENVYKFDVIAGFVDLTAYAKTSDLQTNINNLNSMNWVSF